MAKYIPPGIEYFPGLKTATLNLDFKDSKQFEELKSLQQLQKKIKLGKSEFYISDLTKKELYPGYYSYDAILISNGPIYPKDLNRKLLQKGFGFKLDVDLNPLKMEHRGYIKYDWKLKKRLSKNCILITEDILPENGCLFENVLFREEIYWCEDCHDEHTRELLIKRETYKTKKEAINGRRKFVRNWMKYFKEGKETEMLGKVMGK